MKNLIRKILIVSAVILFVFVINKIIKIISYPVRESFVNYGEQRRKVKLFFLHEEGYLKAEEREVTTGRTVLEDIKICIYELIKGPKESSLVTSIPPDTTVREVFIDDNKCAYIDFNNNFIKNHPGGTAAELYTINSIVNTLITNFEQVSSVRFLVNGGEIDSIAGHINLGNPIRQR